MGQAKAKGDFIKRWRKAGMPRLYFRSQHPRWRTWEANVFAMSINGTVRTYYSTWDDLMADLAYVEQLQWQPPEPEEIYQQEQQDALDQYNYWNHGSI